MTEDMGVRDGQGRSRSGERPARTSSRRTRGGLGRGLGALIPDAEESATNVPPRPLDVLFPDLVGGKDKESATERRTRGGSARDLLEPGRAGGRERVYGKAARGKTDESQIVASSTDGESDEIVSRETISAAGGNEGLELRTESDDLVSEVVAEIRARQGRPGIDGEDVGDVLEIGLDSEDDAEGASEKANVDSWSVSERNAHSNGSVGDSVDEHEIVSRETISGSADLPSDDEGIAGIDVETAHDTGPMVGNEVETTADEIEEPKDVTEDDDVATALTQVPGASFGTVSPAWIIPNLKQPRQVFDEEELAELSSSISEVGVLQPIVVRRITEETLQEEGQRERLMAALEESPEARYELIMGERRWRAAQKAGLEEIPVIVRSTDQDDLLREALIENMHRVQLNPLEEAAAYNQLMEDFNYTQEELSKKIARSRPQIANTLRLLRLPPSVQRQVAAGVLSAGHARALLSMESVAEMEALGARIVAEGLSVRATEEIAKFGKRQPQRKPKAPAIIPPAAQRVADAVAGMLDTSVTVAPGAKRGRLVIHYADQDDLERIAGALGLQ